MLEHQEQARSARIDDGNLKSPDTLARSVKVGVIVKAIRGQGHSPEEAQRDHRRPGRKVLVDLIDVRAVRGEKAFLGQREVDIVPV